MARRRVGSTGARPPQPSIVRLEEARSLSSTRGKKSTYNWATQSRTVTRQTRFHRVGGLDRPIERRPGVRRRWAASPPRPWSSTATTCRAAAAEARPRRRATPCLSLAANVLYQYHMPPVFSTTDMAQQVHGRHAIDRTRDIDFHTGPRYGRAMYWPSVRRPSSA